MTSTTSGGLRWTTSRIAGMKSWRNADGRRKSGARLCRMRNIRGVARVSPMEKALSACDELAGFITACALVKPGKSMAEVEAKSVRKKMKDKAFARSVNRDDIVNGAADLGVELEEHIAFCIEAMKGIAGELGLDGSGAKTA